MEDASDQLLQNSWHCVFVILSISFSGAGVIMNGFVVMNPITPAINKTYSEIYHNRYGIPMPNTTWTTLLALTMSVLYFGGFFGSLLVNSLLRRFTRRQVLLWIYVINSIGLIIVAIGAWTAGSYEMVICGRFIVGVSLGLGMAIFPLVINEYSVPHKRLQYGSIYGALMALTALTTIIMAWSKVLGNEDNYLGALLYGLCYPMTYFVCMYWIPETPYQAVLKNDSDMAARIHRRLRMQSQAALMEHAYSNVDKHDLTSELKSEATWMEIFTVPQFRKHFAAIVVLCSYLSASGAANVLFFSDKLFTEAGLPKDAVTPASMGLYGISTTFSAVVVLSMRKFDSQPVILGTSILVALSHALMTASIETFDEAPPMSWVSLVALWTFMAGYSAMKTIIIGVAGILCVDKTRSKCLSVGASAYWLVGWIVGFISPYLTVWIQGYAFLVWMTITILYIIYIRYCVPKTRNRTEADIQKFFMQ